MHLYAWMSDPSLTARNSWYLHTGGLGGWIARAIMYFVIWIGLAYVLNQPWRAAGQPAERRSAALPGTERLGIGAVLVDAFRSLRSTGSCRSIRTGARPSTV